MPQHPKTEIILAIETSCDDTCVGIVEKGHKIHANVLSSQNEIHTQFGGIIPELAARSHLEKIGVILEIALQKACMSLSDIHAFAVTHRPGLASSLLVGVSFAKALSYATRLPILGINHIEGHLFACHLEKPDLPFPHLCLMVSGGHTFLVIVEKRNQYRMIGQTTDDAAGEAFDKVARHLGLGFPGGPIIEKMAAENRETPVFFPKAMLYSGDFNFSFSGLKTAVKYYVESLSKEEAEKQKKAIAAGFQKALVDVLVEKTIQAAQKYSISTITLSGGVAANRFLRSRLSEEAQKRDIGFYYPSIILCTDNAAMIAGLAYYKYQEGEQSDLSLALEENSQFMKSRQNTKNPF
ncbi:MAG: tRNA (adenosine(37)-N6)-threonylcarbamoyltransferase complex transferase subunit TsaD [Candidatus Brocadiae bacterium]|nr:tRNA (adenosine(37)-N6)-threonylcarbamoyltransferase complex transferase subunit TsaD [Candidatus Brocadiia bacterium]